MSGLKSGLVKVVVAGALGVFTVVGCTADGTSGDTGDTLPADPGAGSTLPPATGGSSGTTPSDGGTTTKKDSSAPDAGEEDAGPPPPVPDTPCPTVDEVKKKSCGACGTQSTICLDVAGTKKWSVYSQCEGELVGGCVPGTVVDEPCGNCGTSKKSCTKFCVYVAQACLGQPANACVPGSVELQNAGCPSGDVYHQRTCGATCTAPNFSVGCSAPPTTIEVGPTIGSISSTITVLSESQTLPRFSGTSCPNPTFLATTITPYTYLRVHNPLAKTAKVNIYNSLAPGGVAFKTTLAAYDGVTSPTDETARKACQKARTYGTTAVTGNSLFASLDGTSYGVTIAAGATVSVYVGSYYAYEAANPTKSTGKVMLNVSTVALQ